jgi:ketosteroid isomerase-like protein
MRLRATTTALALCADLLLPAAAHAAGALDEKVKAAYAAWDAAFNKGDAKVVASFYADDAKLLPPSHDVHEGPAGAEKFFSGLLGNGVTGHKLELIEAMGDERMPVAAAKWSASGKDASGAAATFSGVATHVFEAQPDGSLKLRLHTFN